MLSLGVGREELRALLEGRDDKAGVSWRLKDTDLAATFGISPQRWGYVKKLLLEEAKPSLRQRAAEERR